MLLSNECWKTSAALNSMTGNRSSSVSGSAQGSAVIVGNESEIPFDADIAWC